MKPEQKNYPQKDENRLEQYYKASFDLKIKNEELKNIIKKDRQSLIEKDQENQELKKILRIAQCPMCDGSGAYIDCEEQFQCQWCDERNKLLKIIKHE